MAEEDLVHLDINGIFAVITLNNPTKFNALTQNLYYRLASLLREAEDNPDVYVTVLIGEGPFFSA
jgi:peroxisomal 3,2-trans-enoyl-CoA isomerase